jgi:hypothetical protein
VRFLRQPAGVERERRDRQPGAGEKVEHDHVLGAEARREDDASVRVAARSRASSADAFQGRVFRGEGHRHDRDAIFENDRRLRSASSAEKE